MIPIGCDNTTIINSSGVIASRPNQVWIGGNLTNPKSLPATAVINIASVDILKLGATPYLLIPSPGNGFAIVVLNVTGYLNFGTVAYAGGTTLQVRTATADRSQAQSAKLLLSTVGRGTAFPLMAETANTTDLQIIANQPVNLLVSGGSNPTTGDSTLTITIQYQIIQI